MACLGLFMARLAVCLTRGGLASPRFVVGPALPVWFWLCVLIGRCIGFPSMFYVFLLYIRVLILSLGRVFCMFFVFFLVWELLVMFNFVLLFLPFISTQVSYLFVRFLIAGVPCPLGPRLP